MLNYKKMRKDMKTLCRMKNKWWNKTKLKRWLRKISEIQKLEKNYHSSRNNYFKTEQWILIADRRKDNFDKLLNEGESEGQEKQYLYDDGGIVIEGPTAEAIPAIIKKIKTIKT